MSSAFRRCASSLGKETGGARAHEAPHPLSVDGRPVATVYTPEREERALRIQQQLLPALASLLAVAHERERLEREAFGAEALRRSDAIKTALIQAVSHDLRTPLATIEQALDGLESGVLALTEEDREQLLRTIRVEHTRLKRLVENLLDLSRLQAGAAESIPELWTADELVAQALEELPDSDRTYRSVRRPDLPAVSVDAVQIQRALVNVLENALRVSPPGEPVHMRVSATRQGAPDPRHRSGAGDPGGGARANLRAVPPRARRARSARAGPRPGDRAGLRRGERRPALGRVAARPGRVVRARAPRRGAARRGSDLTGQRVLVVDDEPQFLRALQTNLRGAGYDVATATTAAEAVSSRRPASSRGDHPRPPAAGRAGHRSVSRAAAVDAGAHHRRLRGRARRPRRSPRSTPAPTTTSPSRSRSESCSRGCARCCDGSALRPSPCSSSASS